MSRHHVFQIQDFQGLHAVFVKTWDFLKTLYFKKPRTVCAERCEWQESLQQVTPVCLLLQDQGGASAEAPVLQGTPGAPAPLPGEPSRGTGAALQTDRQHPG